MTNNEKFEGFKQKMVDDNEEKYGKEIRAKYGDDTVNKSNSKVKNMTQEQHDEVTKLGNEIAMTLAEAFKTGDPASEKAQKAAELHKQWLMYYWNEYSKEGACRTWPKCMWMMSDLRLTMIKTARNG